MRHFILNFSTLFLLSLCLISCDQRQEQRQEQQQKKEIKMNDMVLEEEEVKKIEAALALHLEETVHTREQQEALTPETVLKNLRDGNNRFTNNNLTARNHSAQVRNSAMGQYPKAVILSCLDSRIPVEDVFDKGIGDLFVARVAGNFANKDILGSMEFGCRVAGAKVIVVLGHPTCGAVKAAIDNVDLGNIGSIVANIRPAVDQLQEFDGEKTSENQNFVTEVSKRNVLHTIDMIRENSSILREMEENNEIMIVGAFYEMETGVVNFL